MTQTETSQSIEAIKRAAVTESAKQDIASGAPQGDASCGIFAAGIRYGIDYAHREGLLSTAGEADTKDALLELDQVTDKTNDPIYHGSICGREGEMILSQETVTTIRRALSQTQPALCENKND